MLYLACTPCVPLFVLALVFGNKGVFRLPGRHGIASVVRWNLCPSKLANKRRTRPLPKSKETKLRVSVETASLIESSKDAVLLPFISIVWSPSRPVMSVHDNFPFLPGILAVGEIKKEKERKNYIRGWYLQGLCGNFGFRKNHRKRSAKWSSQIQNALFPRNLQKPTVNTKNKDYVGL